MNQKIVSEFEYNKISEEFKIYKSFAESTIDILNEKVRGLEKKIDIMTNIMEISKYINLSVSEADLIQKINDMIIGIMGVEFSTIYIRKDEEFVVEATNIRIDEFEKYEKSYYSILDNKNSFIVNCRNRNGYSLNGSEFHSIVGVPINFRGNILGYIVIEQSKENYFGSDHVNFLSTISNHIGIALDNNFMYMKIKENSIKDPLLRIFNRKYFFDKVEDIIASEPNKKFAILMADIDDFKKLNDGYGHQFGDNVLGNVTDILLSNLEEEDILARYGGEELIVYFHEAEDEKLLIHRIERIRQQLKDKALMFGDKKVIATLSFGLSFYPDDSNNIDGVVSIADKNLYISKNTGKDKVTYKIK